MECTNATPVRVSSDESGETAPTVRLTAEQEAVADGILQRVLAGELHTAVDAAGGSGKTELCLQVADRCEAHGLTVGFSALAHRAVGVLRNRRSRKGGDFRTLAKLMAVRDIGNDARPNFQHDPSAEPLFGQADVEFIDEGSMVNEQMATLLGELSDQFPHVRVVVLGDQGQLPAIGDPPGTISHMLRPQDPAGLFTLKTIHRHAGPVLQLANVIRALELGAEPDWYAYIDGDQILRHGGKHAGIRAMQQLVAEHHADGLSDQIRWLAWRNATVDDAAAASLEAITERDLSRPYQQGDLLLTRAPVHDPRGDVGFNAIAEIPNADELTITTKPIRVQSLSLPGWRGDDEVPLSFVWECFVHSTTTGKEHRIWLPHPGDRREVQRLIDDCQARNRKAQKHANDKFEGKTSGQWRYRGRVLLQTLGHGTTHRTACTVHRAQGGQWGDVFVDVADMRGLLKGNGDRKADPFLFRAMLYTAVTRCAGRLHLVGV